MHTRGLMQASSLPVRLMAALAVWLSGTATLVVLLDTPLPLYVLPAVILVVAYLYSGFDPGLVADSPRVAGRADAGDDGLSDPTLADHFVAKEFAAARRGRDVTLVMFGFSRFDDFTDREGAAAAAAALREFGRVLQKLTRQMNLSARYGWRADAFLSVLSGANAAAAQVFITRVRETVATLDAPMPEIEVGVAVYQPHIASPDEFVESALRALEAARAANGGYGTSPGKVPPMSSPVRSVTGRRAATFGRANMS
jgi:diguanylate cyclase (GGDEF)-like protein